MKKIKNMILYYFHNVFRFINNHQFKFELVLYSLVCLIGICFAYQGNIYLNGGLDSEFFDINGDYTDFGLAYDWIIVTKFHSWLFIDPDFESSLVGFELSYTPRRNGTEGVMIIFPFNITKTPSIPPNFTITNYKHGSILHGNITIDDAGLVDNKVIRGSAIIQNTFIQGRDGRYLIVMPYQKRISISGIVDEVRSKYEISVHTGGYELQFDFRHPDTFSFQNAFPNYDIGPSIKEDDSTTYLGYSWIFNEPSPINVYLEDTGKIYEKERDLFAAALFLGIGFPLLLQGIIEIFKLVLKQIKDVV